MPMVVLTRLESSPWLKRPILLLSFWMARPLSEADKKRAFNISQS
jgi:hypothetical protein